MADVGNFSDNPNELGEIRTEALLEGMARIGYQVVNVGQRELALGYEAFASKTADVPFKLVSTNIVRKDTGEPVFEPYEILELRGGKGPVRVGVFGVVRFSPVWQKAGPPGTNLGIARPADMIRRYIGEVEKKVDAVVLLAALSKSDAHTLATEIPGIDFILGAYGGMYNSREEKVGESRIYYCGNQGQRVGEARVYLDTDRSVIGATSFLHFLTDRYPEDEEMKAFVKGIADKLNALKGENAKVSSLPEAVPDGRPVSDSENRAKRVGAGAR